MKKTVISLVVILIVAIFCAWGVFEIFDGKMEKRIEAAYMKIEDIDLTKVPNGVYRGRFGEFLVDVDLEVTVKEGRIAGISIKEQKCGKGYEALESVDRILRRQTPKVDGVSGATLSSKCIMIATYLALREK